MAIYKYFFQKKVKGGLDIWWTSFLHRLKLSEDRNSYQELDY